MDNRKATTGHEPGAIVTSGMRTVLWLVLGVLLAGLPLGCSRAFWRNQADRDSYRILERKMNDPRWVVPRIDVAADPRSRFFDPYDPDKPPLPPDDPAAHYYMHQLNGMKGYKNWYRFGIASSIENPQWLAPFGLTPEMTVCREKDYLSAPLPKLDNLTLVDAVELSNIHSREYQTQLEDTYLNALALTFERFQFGVRYLGFTGEPSADVEFESIPGVENSLSLGTAFGISQLLPTGAQLVVELANNTLWLFDGNGPDQSLTRSILSYSIVQPLLEGAGRRVVLEPLTQAERNVLYSVRDLARFRKIFFVNIASDYLDLMNTAQQVKNLRGNVLRTEEQTEIQRALASRRPPVISAPLPALPEGLQIPDTFREGASQAQLPVELQGQLLYDPEQQQLSFRGDMSAEQARMLRELSDDPAYQAAVIDIIERVQVDTTSLDVLQLQSRLVGSVNALRAAETGLLDQLDAFKVRLGLPPDMEVTLDESLLDQFELIDPELSDLEQRIKDFVVRLADLDFDEPDLPMLRDIVADLPNLMTDVRENALTLIETDFQRVAENLPDRLERLETEQERDQVREYSERDQRLFQGLLADYADVENRLNELKKQLEAEELPREATRAVASEVAELREALLKISQSAQVIQIGLRSELISLAEFTMGLQEAVAYALENRMDLKNALATVTDARRQLEVVANALQGVVNVRAEGDVATPLGDNPFDFRGVASSFRAGIGFVAPLDQIDERNSYRTAVINYQRARRDYMAFEDLVKTQVRTSWRRLDLLRRNFETTRQAIRITALEFDSAVEQAANPVQQIGGGGQSAALNLLQALANVLAAQNDLVDNAVSYEQQRLNIYRDMDIMEIDQRGLWVDDIYQDLAAQQQENTRSGRPADELGVPPAVDEVPDEGIINNELDAAGTRVVPGDDNGSAFVDGISLEVPPEPEAVEDPQPAPLDGAAAGDAGGPAVGDGGAGSADAEQPVRFQWSRLLGVHH